MLIRSQGPSVAGRIKSIKNPNNLIGNRIRDLRLVVPQPIAVTFNTQFKCHNSEINNKRSQADIKTLLWIMLLCEHQRADLWLDLKYQQSGQLVNSINSNSRQVLDLDWYIQISTDISGRSFQRRTPLYHTKQLWQTDNNFNPGYRTRWSESQVMS
jgi:hypothetical protein